VICSCNILSLSSTEIFIHIVASRVAAMQRLRNGPTY
jgi:hypothetical protein